MTKRLEKRAVLLEVIPAGLEQEPSWRICFSCMRMILVSSMMWKSARTDGLSTKSLPLYWSEPGRHPFLMKAEGKLAGFVLVKKGSEISRNEKVWDMAEFFVLRGYRRRGIGTRVAHEVWRRFPGLWEVRVMEANVSAHYFWARLSPDSSVTRSILRASRRWGKLEGLFFRIPR